MKGALGSNCHLDLAPNFKSGLICSLKLLMPVHAIIAALSPQNSCFGKIGLKLFEIQICSMLFLILLFEATPPATTKSDFFFISNFLKFFHGN